MTSRGWCFTLYDFENEDLPTDITPENKLKYGIYQLERCPNTGTLHVQGYFEFSTPVRWRFVQRITGDPDCHVEPRIGTPKQASDYCRKLKSAETNPTEFGELPEGPGSRSDLLQVQEALNQGATPQEIAQDFFPAWSRYHRAFERYYLDRAPAREWPMEVHVRYGVTGSGKTFGVYDIARQAGLSVYDVASPNISNGAVWFCGYTGQDIIILDDFYGWLPWTFFLKLLDRYPLRVQTKGGTVPFLSKRIYITSNVHPNQWYNYGQHMHFTALERRITTIEHFETPYSPTN